MVRGKMKKNICQIGKDNILKRRNRIMCSCFVALIVRSSFKTGCGKNLMIGW